MRVAAVAYGALVAFAAIWAIYVDLTMYGSAREHLLPDVLLMVMALPLSLSGGLMYQNWPVTFGNEFVQVGWMSTCGLLQATTLYVVGLLRGRSNRAA